MPCRAALLALLALVLLPAAASAAPRATPDEAWGANGEVFAVAAAGEHVFLGGSFDYVGPNTGSGAAVNAVDGSLPPASQFPHVLGEIRAVISDGNGGWYIGGDFSQVGSSPIQRLAHIDADGSLDTAFAPPTPDNTVSSLALSYNDGSLGLIVGGSFDALGATPRNHLAAVHLADGALSAWNPNVDSDVYTVATSQDDPGHVWVGGRFTHVGGQARAAIARVSYDGTVTAFAPVLSATAGVLDVNDIAISGGNAYAVGDFDHVDGATRGFGAAFALDTGATTGWDPLLDFIAEDVTAGFGNVYINGGVYKSIHAVDGTIGAPLPGFTSTLGGLYDVALSPDGGRLYVTDSEHGAHRGIQSLNPATGVVDEAFDATVGDIGTLDGGGQALAVDGTRVFVGGGFRSVGGTEIRNLAALDATSGAIDPDFDPAGTDTRVTSLAVTDADLLVGTGEGVAGYGLGDGTRDLGFVADTNGDVRAMAVRNGWVYLGGGFGTVNDTARDGLAAVSPTDGTLDSGFTPVLDGGDTNVYGMTATDDTVYAGGRFTTAGGATHTRIVALDAATGAVRSGFTASADNDVKALLVSGGKLYAGGTFSEFDGVAHKGLVAVDPATGAVDSAFDPQLGGYAYSLAALGGQLYAGGNYDTPRHSLATLNATTGAVLPGAPADVLGESQSVYTLATSAGRLLAGGAFDYAGGLMRSDAATFSDPIPQNTAPPAILGTAKPGASVTCTDGSWTSAPTGYAFEWRVDGIVVATTRSYQVKSADAGKPLTCRVTASNANGSSAQAISDPVTVLAPPENTSPPTIEPALTAGDTAHCDHGSWSRSPASYNYQWTLNGSLVVGAADATYTTSRDDAGKALRCLVSAVNDSGTSLPVASAPTTLATPPAPTPSPSPSPTPTGAPTAAPSGPGAPVNTAKPTVALTKGKPAPKTPPLLACSPGTWTGADAGAFEYRWYQDGRIIGGATTNVLALTHDQTYYGATLTCAVVGNGPGGFATAVSDPYVITGSCDTMTEPPGVLKNDPAGEGPTIDYCAQGKPTAPSEAEPVGTRLPLAAGCDQTGGFSYLRVKGCFATDGTKQIFQGNFTMNGLDFKPVLAGTYVTFDSKDFKASIGEGHKGSDHFDGTIYTSDKNGNPTSGMVEVYAGPSLLFKNTLKWDVPQETGSGEFELVSFDPLKDADVEGLKIAPGQVGKDPGQGEGISIKVDQAYEAKLDMALELPPEIRDIIEAFDINDVTGAAQLVTNPDEGLTRNSIKFTKQDLWVGGLHLQDINAAYSEKEDLWEGGLTITLPFENGPTVKGLLQLHHGDFKGVAVDVSGLNIPVFPLVFLQELRAAFQVNPLYVAGGAGISIGKPVAGVYPAGVDGNLSYRWPTMKDPGKFHADGALSLFDVPFEKLYFDYFTDDFFDFGFRAEIGLPDYKSDEPEDQPVYIGGGLDGWVQWPQFSVHGQVDADLNFINIGVEAQVVASSKALAVCGGIGPIEGGGAYIWAAHDFDFFTGCDLGPFEVPRPPGHTRQAVVVDGAAQVALPGGGQLLKLTGTTAAPRPVVTGPGGQSYTATLDAKHPLVNDDVAILEDDKDKTTYVGLKDSEGTWTLTPQAGTAPITGAQVAQVLPDPKVKVSVTGRGTHRRLHWSVTPAQKGQELKLVESTKYGSRLVLDTRKSRGAKRFVPGPGEAGTRTFDATVVNPQGIPRKAVTGVGSYRAPSVPEVARVKRVKPRLKGTTLTATWPKVKRAATYIVTLRGKGLKVGLTARRRARFPNLILGKPGTARLTVRALARSGRPGPARTVKVRLRKRRH